MATGVSIKFDFGKLDDFAERLGSISQDQLGQIVVSGLNKVLESAFDLAQSRMLATINLDPAYVNRKMEKVEATRERPVAEIVAPFGSKADLTTLSHYGAMLTTTATAHPDSAGRPDWAIPPGQKQGHPSVEVQRGDRKQMQSSKAFIIPKLKDNQGNPLIFKRKASGSLAVVYGPSVYQLFGVTAGDIEVEVSDDLADKILAMAGDAVERALT